MEIYNDLIIRFADGQILEVVPKSAKAGRSTRKRTRPQTQQDLDSVLNRPLQEGDTIFEGYGTQLEKFGAEQVKRTVRRGFAAITELNEQATLISFSWLGSLKDAFNWL